VVRTKRMSPWRIEQFQWFVSLMTSTKRQSQTTRASARQVDTGWRKKRMRKQEE